MKKFFLVGSVLLFLSAGWVQSQENPSQYLNLFERKYSGLKDYTAEVRIHFDMEALKAPDMDAKVYYKSPDKVKIESKGVFLFPREAGYFNPSRFKPDQYEIRLLERLSLDGKNAVRLQLIPKEAKKSDERFVLTMDVDRILIREIKTFSAEGREVRASIDYRRFGDFDLPSHIKLEFELPPTETNETKGLIPFGRKAKPVTGVVEMTYSRYTVNSGLSDQIFKEVKSRKLDPF